MPISDAAASLFYERLFELDPSVRPLFKNDMREQKKKLMQTISVAVDGLASVDKLVPVLKALGARHLGYMVEDRHYDVVGEALLWTLKEGLGDAFTPDVKRAWQEVYGVLARVMKQGAMEAATKAEGNVRFAAAEPAPAARPATPRGGAVVVGVGRPMVDLPPDSTHPAGRTLVGVAAAVSGSAGKGASASASTATTSSPFPARTVELVQKSWGHVLPISDAAASLFYERLFELDPSVRQLFKDDLREQKKKLMQMLTVAVDGLSNPARLVPTLQALGARHAGYMVQERHYDLVGQALLWTLKEGLGNLFTPEVEGAWTSVYGLVADVMKKAAAHQETPVAAPRSDADEDTRVRPPARPAAPPPVARSVAPYSSTPPPDTLDTMPAAAPLPGAPPEPRQVILHIDGQSLPPLQVRVALDMPSPYLGKGREPEAQVAAQPQGKDGLVAGILLGTLCLVASMVGSGIAALASDRMLRPTVLLGVPLATLALTVTAFAFGALWGRARSGAGQHRSS